MTAPFQPVTQSAPSVFQYWDTEAVPDDVSDLFDSFRSHNPDLSHRIFSEPEAEQFIASQLGLRERDAFRACAVPAMQADYFRYCAVLACGGIYADADFQCVRSLRPLLGKREGGVVFLRPDMHTAKGLEAQRMENAFFAFEQPGHPFLRMTVEIATANLEARIAERIWPVGENVREAIWLTTGQGIFTLMRFLYSWGSFDAFLDRVPGTIVEPFSDLICEVIGPYDRIVEAFDGVRVASYEDMLTWVNHPDGPLAYKGTERHWHNVKTAIFK